MAIGALNACLDRFFFSDTEISLQIDQTSGNKLFRNRVYIALGVQKVGFTYGKVFYRIFTGQNFDFYSAYQTQKKYVW